LWVVVAVVDIQTVLVAAEQEGRSKPVLEFKI